MNVPSCNQEDNLTENYPTLTVKTLLLKAKPTKQTEKNKIKPRGITELLTSTSWPLSSATLKSTAYFNEHSREAAAATYIS